MIRLYMDVHISGSLVKALRERGIDILTAREDHQGRTLDPILLDRAMELDRVLFTHDDDFLHEAARRQESGIPFAGIIYIHLLNFVIGRCADDLELIANVYTPEDLAGRVEYLPL